MNNYMRMNQFNCDVCKNNDNFGIDVTGKTYCIPCTRTKNNKCKYCFNSKITKGDDFTLKKLECCDILICDICTSKHNAGFCYWCFSYKCLTGCRSCAKPLCKCSTYKCECNFTNKLFCKTCYYKHVKAFCCDCSKAICSKYSSICSYCEKRSCCVKYDPSSHCNLCKTCIRDDVFKAKCISCNCIGKDVSLDCNGNYMCLKKSCQRLSSVCPNLCNEKKSKVFIKCESCNIFVNCCVKSRSINCTTCTCNYNSKLCLKCLNSNSYIASKSMIKSELTNEWNCKQHVQNIKECKQCNKIKKFKRFNFITGLCRECSL